jgi:glutathione S-transferase
MTSRLVVHHLGISQSERIVWLCEELGLDYTLDRHDRDPVTRLAPAAYKAIHPRGTAPVITDGDVVLSESGAIMDYILARYGQGRLTVSPDSPDFPHYLFWMHFTNASLVSSEMIRIVTGALGIAADDPRLAFSRARADNAFDLVEQRLGEAPYLGGAEFSAADIMTVFALTTMRVFAPRDLAPYPSIRAYLQRIGERPAYRRAMEKGDPGFPPMLA